MSQFSRGNLTGLGDELFHRHVHIIESVKVHLRLIEFVLEVETLLDKFKLNQSRYDLTSGQLLSPHDFDHFLGPLRNLLDSIPEDVLVRHDSCELGLSSRHISLEEVYSLLESLNVFFNVQHALLQL